MSIREPVIFDESMYHGARKQGLTWQGMMDNIDKRAVTTGKDLAKWITDSQSGYPEYNQRRFDEIMAEAQEMREYRAAFTDFLHVELAKPEYRRKPAGTPSTQ